MEKSLNQRIKFILDNCFDGNKTKMAKAIGLEYQHINNWTKGSNLPNLPAYLKLFETVQNTINPIWYLTGSGHELVTTDSQYTHANSDEKLQLLNEIATLKTTLSLKQKLIDSQERVISLLTKKQ